VKRLSIRILVALALCAALAAFAAAPIPVDAREVPALPAVALEQPALYRLEVALGVFYGGLLLITPAFSGLVIGRLPIEISARGAKFAEEADQSAAVTKAAINELKETSRRLSEDLTAATVSIKRLNEMSERDNTQPEVVSDR
jgi:hypothetical protein